MPGSPTAFLFIVYMMSFEEQFLFYEVPIYNLFSSLVFCLTYLKNICEITVSFSGNFIVFGCIFRCVFHFKLIFMYVVRKGRMLNPYAYRLNLHILLSLLKTS